MTTTYLNPVYKSNWYLILLTTHISKLLTNNYWYTIFTKYFHNISEDNSVKTTPCPHKRKNCRYITKLLTTIPGSETNQTDIVWNFKAHYLHFYQYVRNIRGVFHLRVSVWIENCTISPQFTLPGTNLEVKCSSYILNEFNILFNNSN